MSLKHQPIRASDPSEILKLCENLYEKNATSIQVKINNYIETQTGAKLVFMVPLMKQSHEAIIQVLGNIVLDHELRFPVTNHILYAAVQRRCSVVSETTELHMDLLTILRTKIHPIPTTFLSIPIQHPRSNEICVLVCLANYKSKENSDFICTRLVQECFRFCLGTVLNSLQCGEENRLKRQNQTLLHVARNLFTHLDDLPELLQEIMLEARRLTNAERCSLFLVDPDHQDLVAKVFDGVASDAVKEVRIAAGKGVAGHVATTGELLNIRCAYVHPLFFKGMDEATGFITRNILCFPIRDDSNAIIGVAQLCNKIGGYHFDVFDEEVATAFSIYCGISMMHSLVYKKIQDSQARNKVSNELMIYHMKVSNEDVAQVTGCKNNHSIVGFDQLSFCPRSLPERETPCFVLWMFQDLDMVKKFNIRIETLARFTLYVRKGYRDTPYHNWMHAFSMIHFGYVLVKNLHLLSKERISELEALAFLVSCLCHDIDHRGTNNSFQLASGNALASLYSSEGSVMERHHLAQAMCILNTDGCNVFDGLARNDYTRCLDTMRHMILATDLAHHFRVVDEQRNMAAEGYDKDDETHRSLLLCLVMTAADLSDQVKGYENSLLTAEMIYKEFFSQGDLEKSMGNAPIEMMDRERAKIPVLQMQFLTNVAIPVFRILAELFPEATSLYNAAQENMLEWSTYNLDSERQQRMNASLAAEALSLSLKAAIEDPKPR